MSALRYPCPCCGYVVFNEAPGSYDICPICDWEDDAVQLKYPDYSGGANGPSLIEAQRNYAEFGTSDARCPPRRQPTPSDVRDPDWRPFDSARDYPTIPSREDWPDDFACLYYWRPSFWLRANRSP